MQNTFSQSGNDSKWFLTNIIFQNRYVALETGLDPAPFMANAILNFHFDFPHPSLTSSCSLTILRKNQGNTRRFKSKYPISTKRTKQSLACSCSLLLPDPSSGSFASAQLDPSEEFESKSPVQRERDLFGKNQFSDISFYWPHAKCPVPQHRQ